MKTFRSILVLVVIIPIVVVVFQATNKVSKVETPNDVNDVKVGENIDLSPEIIARQLCYIWNTEAGDKAMLSMDIRGEKVIGEFYFLPAEKDSKIGIFKGSIISLSSEIGKWVVDVIWDASGEGVVNKEQLWIVVSGSMASPGFGEMKDRGDGVYVYADPEQISYDLNLQQTDCGDEAME